MGDLLNILFWPVVIVILWLVYRNNKKTNERKKRMFMKFAQKRNLNHSIRRQFFYKFNIVEGTLNGCKFKLFESMSGANSQKEVVTSIKFYDSPINFDFKISEEHLFSKTGKLLGKEDIQLGDEALDKYFLFKSNNESEFKCMMNFEAQKELNNIKYDIYSPIRQKDSILSYYVYAGGLVNEDIFSSTERVIDFMINLMNQSSNKKDSLKYR